MSTLRTILFGADGRTIVGTSESLYSRNKELTSTILDSSRTEQLHLICHDDRWIVVTRTGSSEHPVIFQHIVASSRNEGIALIDDALRESAHSSTKIERYPYAIPPLT